MSGVAAALPPSGAYFRLAGANRYATAVAVSQDLVCGPTETADQCEGLGGVDAPVQTVFVASGTDFPDALGAGPLASGLGPLLLVPPTGTVPAVVKAQPSRIDPTDIVIFGGTGAVSSGVATQLAAYGSISRIAGTNRYDTAATALQNDDILLQQDTDDDGTPDDLGTQLIVLASGEGFADALSGGGAAANNWGSLLLTGERLPALCDQERPSDDQAPEGHHLGRRWSAGLSRVPSRRSSRRAPCCGPPAPTGSGTAIALSKMVFPSGANELFLVNGLKFPGRPGLGPVGWFLGRVDAARQVDLRHHWHAHREQPAQPAAGHRLRWHRRRLGQRPAPRHLLTSRGLAWPPAPRGRRPRAVRRPNWIRPAVEGTGADDLAHAAPVSLATSGSAERRTPTA